METIIKEELFKYLRNSLLLVFLIFFLGSCIDKFNPELKSLEPILVVDALITNEDRSCEVELSRTKSEQNSQPPMVSGAVVIIKDQKGNESKLEETAAGIYKTDSLHFHGVTGNAYTLYIKTAGGAEYESDPCRMYPVQKIDTIYFSKDQEFQNNGKVTQDGIRIFLDSKNNVDGKYFRWIYNEWWKFSLPTPKLYDYIDEFNIPAVTLVKRVCYCYNESDEIIIHSTVSTQSDKIEKEPILFLASGVSDRLLIQYSIEIKQLSLSETEYQFWEQMKQINETGRNLFENQPFSIIGNIHNIHDHAEPVLGYFQVSGVEQKRIYIIPEDIAALNLPAFTYECERLAAGPADYFPSPMTFDKINTSYTSSGFYFIGPVHDLWGNLQKLVFTSPECADCTVRGSLRKPDFWIDSESSPGKK